ncbi:MAG: metal-binding protein, partial [Gammaproteobacteria bacterium]|nr:metal-binding protein [Gammaproteobacteria bacterium]
MSKRPPDIIDPLEFAEKGRVVEGVLQLMELDRLRDQLFATSGEVRFHLRFVKEGAVPGARGRIETELHLQCQACLGSLTYGVASEVAVGFVGS